MCLWYDNVVKKPIITYQESSPSVWSAGSPLITARHGLSGGGSDYEGFVAGGCSNTATTTCTEEYNGLTWSAGGAMITARQLLSGFGTQNEGLIAGGLICVTATYTCTEEYNGITWSAGGALITARHSLGGAGTQNLGLVRGGIMIILLKVRYNIALPEFDEHLGSRS